MSVTSVAEVRALVSTGMTDPQLQAVIDREEAILANAVGPLTGARTEIFTVTEESADLPIRLRRQAASVTVTEANTALADVRLAADGRTLVRLTATGWATTPWTGVVEPTYTPVDESKIKNWVIALIRDQLAETGFDSQSTGTYSYSRGGRTPVSTLAAARRDILGTQRTLGTVRVTTTYSPVPAWVGAVRP